MDWCSTPENSWNSHPLGKECYTVTKEEQARYLRDKHTNNDKDKDKHKDKDKDKDNDHNPSLNTVQIKS